MKIKTGDPSTEEAIDCGNEADQIIRHLMEKYPDDPAAAMSVISTVALNTLATVSHNREMLLAGIDTLYKILMDASHSKAFGEMYPKVAAPERKLPESGPPNPSSPWAN